MHYEDFESALEEFATFKRQIEDAYEGSVDVGGKFDLLEGKKRELWGAITGSAGEG